MKITKLILFLCSVLAVQAVRAQELNAKVTINAQRVATTIDRKIFTTLQTQLTNLLNNRKWTNENYLPAEKIQCSFLMNLESTEEPNVYRGALVVQAARPIHSSSYNSALLNFQDADLIFKYQEFQPVEFNENRVQGNDALTANLTAVVAYYAYLILGFDHNSFAPKSGEPYFQKSLNIVNNAPENNSISGWRSFDGIRNRYWLAENLLNNRYNLVHDVLYLYYRNGLDNLYANAEQARTSILDAMTQLQAFNRDNPNTMILQTFLQNRQTELIGIFKKASPQQRSRAIELLPTIDVPNAALYRQELK